MDPRLKKRRMRSSAPHASRQTDRPLAPGESIADRKEKRHSTVASDERRKVQAKADALRKKPARKPVEEIRKLTQVEVLMEAARTELINKASLERLMKLEDELKKEATKKRQLTGPRIKYHSRTYMKDTHDATKRQRKDPRIAVNMMTFTDVMTVPLGYQRHPSPKPALCVISGKLAKYRDPLTKHPYASLVAFKEIRRRHKAGEKIQPYHNPALAARKPPTLKPASKAPPAKPKPKPKPSKPAPKITKPTKAKPPPKIPQKKKP